MFIPSNALMPQYDPNEVNRVKSGRPATRAEILDRSMRQHRLNTVTVMPDRSIDARSDQGKQHETAHTSPNPVISIRRGLSRALITVGERIKPQAA